MNLTKILWRCLISACTIIVLMLGAWGAARTAHDISTDQRLNTVEQHYAAIQSDLQDLREHVKEISAKLDREKK